MSLRKKTLLFVSITLVGLIVAVNIVTRRTLREALTTILSERQPLDKGVAKLAPTNGQ